MTLDLDAMADCRGIGRNILEQRITALVAAVHALSTENVTMLANLSATQKRCTELTEALRAVCSPEIGMLLAEVAKERARADGIHGEQRDLPFVRRNRWNAPQVDPTIDYGISDEVTARRNYETERALGTLTHGDIIVEEVAEAICAAQDGEARAELVQVACVAIGAIRAIDSQRSARTTEEALLP